MSGTQRSVLDSFRLDERRAFVTGGAAGIGAAIAIALAEAGADVAVLDIDAEAAEAVAEAVRQNGRRGLAVRCDVTSPADVAATIDQVVGEFGGLDIAVNNAGIVVTATAEEMSSDDWDRVMEVNLRGVFLCAQRAGRVMLEQGRGGSILNTASMSASIVNHPQPQCSYNASKAGVVQLTKSLASEWAAAGIRVNSLSPGYTSTLLTSGDELAELRAQWTALTPIPRMAEVDDLTGPAVFLVSDAARFMTGHDLVVDGGYTIR
jgi:NAD(P)-dependent dehydrogenase (short-subunit alcohol dehydrogenase family)